MQVNDARRGYQCVQIMQSAIVSANAMQKPNQLPKVISTIVVQIAQR
jgi:hypothetical protein